MGSRARGSLLDKLRDPAKPQQNGQSPLPSATPFLFSTRLRRRRPLHHVPFPGFSPIAKAPLIKETMPAEDTRSFANNVTPVRMGGYFSRSDLIAYLRGLWPWNDEKDFEIYVCSTLNPTPIQALGRFSAFCISNWVHPGAR
jgi:hypothetical protein